MTQHTQGKWRAINYGDTIGWAVESTNGEHVCADRMPYPADSAKRKEANAKLIAQSPTMHLFITEFVSALKDKSKPSTWEKALLHGAEEILKATE